MCSIVVVGNAVELNRRRQKQNNYIYVYTHIHLRATRVLVG